MLKYRFGPLDNVELEFPKAATPAKEVFAYQEATGSVSDGWREVTFESGTATYTVHTRIADSKGSTRILVVPAPGEGAVEIPCDDDLRGSLTNLADVVRFDPLPY